MKPPNTMASRPKALFRRPRLDPAMEPVVIVFGGSVVAPRELDGAFLRQVAETLQDLSRAHPLLVVVGGGAPARQYIEAARHLSVGEEDLDRIGVAATRLNAQMLASILDAWKVPVTKAIPTTIADAVDAMESGCPLVVMGGTTPGHSTDYVGAELAIAAGATRLVIATNVKGVYTRDPRKHPEAEHRPELSFQQLLEIIQEREWTAAGAPGVIDGPATTLIATHGVPTHVVEGHDLRNLGRAARGEPFEGTRVHGEKVVLA